MTISDEAKTLLRGAYAMRARAYAHMWDVLVERFGREEALEIGKAMTFRLGTEMGERFEAHGPADIPALADAFLASIPIREEMFAPEVIECDAERLVIQFHRCPLKEAWQAAGREGEELADLCRMAGAIDAGLFGRAGFTFKGETWTPGREGCCRLVVEPGAAPDAAA